MERMLGAYAPQLYALMRIIVGLLFLCHGLQKIFGLFGGVDGQAVPLFSIYGAAGLIEIICGALVTIGLVTGWAAFIASGEMAAAYFTAHFPMGFWPIENQGELAVLYCFVFLYMAARGAGVWSVDRSRGG
ncbi:MAG TPA: DoxX family protein [Candidatus Binatia bacterium]|nr:DoxX family protein [Candidatus Binatia bacterium]